ncbi:Hypothetical predicted protein [Mytilus galloprovincialis]|uniref:Uncharacterized protein n=1 Tax=Mytilus galloprovincialis TaxID=29158 RepID=A0A8B6G9N6_MYTGA|nr:Hypothetical predicted protein [Mytilus galloprovincialis]
MTLSSNTQNSQIVHILTEIDTPVRQNVDNDDSIGDSQDLQDISQGTHFIPNQVFIAMLDLVLIDLPIDSYIVKLIELTNDSDDTTTWYRSMLREINHEEKNKQRFILAKVEKVEKLGKANRTVIEKLQTENEKLRRELDDSNERLSKRIVFSERRVNSCTQQKLSHTLPQIAFRSVLLIVQLRVIHAIHKCDHPKRRFLTVQLDSQQSHVQMSLQKKSTIYKNDEPTTFKIPVRLQGATAAVQSTDEYFLTGVSPKRSARYYFSGINSKSTCSEIMTYIESRNVQVTYLRLFQSRNSLRCVSAKLNVSKHCANINKGEIFGPGGVHCRCWFSNQAWYQRSSEVPSDLKKAKTKNFHNE